MFIAGRDDGVPNDELQAKRETDNFFEKFSVS
jgi:hypothetical protein